MAANQSLDAAKVFIAMIPMLVVYPFLQKYFINGIMLGAVQKNKKKSILTDSRSESFFHG